MKKYALLGPEAVREEFLTRSILDDTSRKSHNMTTSINHSKRIDKVFHKNEACQSVLGGKLDLSITPTRWVHTILIVINNLIFKLREINCPSQIGYSIIILKFGHISA